MTSALKVPMEVGVMLLLARIVRIVTALVVGFIVVGIVLHLLDANSGNAIVGFVYDVAGWLVTPFKGIFSPSGAKLKIAVNWGLAAVVYAIVGGLIAGLLARASLAGSGRGFGRRNRAAGV
jgi:hypothetical protein